MNRFEKPGFKRRLQKPIGFEVAVGLVRVKTTEAETQQAEKPKKTKVTFQVSARQPVLLRTGGLVFGTKLVSVEADEEDNEEEVHSGDGGEDVSDEVRETKEEYDLEVEDTEADISVLGTIEDKDFVRQHGWEELAGGLQAEVVLRAEVSEVPSNH
ncbi:hypothetical protein K435DRAFT_810527 [Dendrothele bispora CBS 962.96]|uniref:Uncharacterized protein n=1 Tax=Dendrothele bispora (strain CBS 962.96) TaxID=1314807 RepID=A0A4V4HBJ3_DENBC|nr:hypothetical protein K435DRAFT_810527 [Dendrothele bispora CBS 962.96]